MVSLAISQTGTPDVGSYGRRRQQGRDLAGSSDTTMTYSVHCVRRNSTHTHQGRYKETRDTCSRNRFTAYSLCDISARTCLRHCLFGWSTWSPKPIAPFLFATPAAIAWVVLILLPSGCSGRASISRGEGEYQLGRTTEICIQHALPDLDKIKKSFIIRWPHHESSYALVIPTRSSTLSNNLRR